MNPAFIVRTISYDEWQGNQCLPNSDKCITVFMTPSGYYVCVYVGKKFISKFVPPTFSTTAYVNIIHINGDYNNLVISVLRTLFPQARNISGHIPIEIYNNFVNCWNNNQINLTGYYLNKVVYRYP